MNLLLAKSTIIGIIVVIALVAISLAVCFYLLSLKDKARQKQDGTEENK